MRSAHAWNPAVAVLAATLILRAHPEWRHERGPRAARDLARRLAREFAAEYLIPYAGRAWIISSSTIREFAADCLAEADQADETDPHGSRWLPAQRLSSSLRETAHGSM
ncbi:MAG: hypothetical protein ABI645_17980 [Pseudomonadota bacterium]